MMARLVAALLLLCPRSFRELWGAELRQVYALAWRRQGSAVGLSTARVRVSLLLDIALMVPRSWRDEHRVRSAGSVRAGERPPDSPRGQPSNLIDGLLTDLRLGLRQWRLAPGFVAVTIGTLSLGMGAAIAIFSVLNGVLLRPMPYSDPDRVALLTRAFHADLPTLEHAPQVADLALWSGWRAGFRDTDGTMSIRHSASVGAGFFEMLGVQAARGRLFSRRDSLADADAVVIAWHTWKNDFGGRSDIIGSTVPLDDRTYTVIGVAPERFADPFGFPINDIETSIYRLHPPLPAQLLTQRQFPSLLAVVRLRPGVTPGTAKAGLDELLAAEYRQNDIQSSLQLQSAHEARVASASTTLLVLAGAVALLVLIGCANASNLLLTRGALRQREMAVRTAIGAGRGRIVRQLLAESLLLATAAALVGTWLGYWGARAILVIGRESIPRSEQVLLDGRVLLFTVLATVTTTVLFGLVPALRVSRSAPAATLRIAGRTDTDSRSGRRLRSLLMGMEVALAVVLTFTAGLVSLSLWKLQKLDTGYDAEEVLTLRVTVSPREYGPEVRHQVRHDVLAALARIPGADGAAVVDYHPLSGGALQANVTVEQVPAAPRTRAPYIQRAISPGYFATMGTRLLLGRDFEVADHLESDPVAILSESLARRLFPDGSALDRSVHLNGSLVRVVGIAQNTKEFSLAEGETPTVYIPMDQIPGSAMIPTSTFLLRAHQGSAAELIGDVRRAVREVDPRLQLAFLRTMREMMDIDLLAPRLRTTLFSAFGLLAAVLAAIGIAGVVGYTVAQSIPEIGVRLALGATRSRIALGVLKATVSVALVGSAAGSLGALAAGRVVASMLFQVPPTNTAVLAVVVATLLFAAVSACLLPLLRAVRVEPAAVLRSS